MKICIIDGRLGQQEEEEEEEERRRRANIITKSRKAEKSREKYSIYSILFNTFHT